MAKKKDKPQVINNIQELNLEIDYKELAQAIVEAQNDAEKQQTERKSFVSNSFAFWISLFFRFVSILGIAVCIIGFITIIQYAINTAIWNTPHNIVANIFVLGTIGLLLISFGAYCIIMWRAAKEIETEKDRNYIISVFSGIVSFAALIVALVALFKEVG